VTSFDCTDDRQCGGRTCLDPQQCQQDLYESNDSAEDASDFAAVARDGTLAAKDTVRGLDTILSPNNSELDFGRVWMDQP